MTEEQRVKLENLITDFEVTVVTANADWGTAEFRKYALKQKQEAHDRITDFLTEIQDDLDRLFHGLARQMRDRELDPHIVNRLNTIAIQHIHDRYEDVGVK